MTALLLELCIDASDPARLADFWAGLLGREATDDPAGSTMLLAGDEVGFPIRFVPRPGRKTGLNQIHLHLTSTSPEHQQATIARALELGGQHLDVGQKPEEGHVVLADPEGNEFCVIEPDNAFLAGCGFLGELACDGSRQVGHFWSRSLGWPL